MAIKVSDMITRCNNLKGKWSDRNKKITEWNDILNLKDVLAQDGMESVVSNDPRTGYNLGRHLMVSSVRSHKVDQSNLTSEQIAATGYVEDYVARRWLEHENRYRSIGKQGFLWQLISLLLATGWYSIFSIVEDEKIWSEVWTPSDVFPDFDDNGLSEVAHIYTVSPRTFMRKAKLMEWSVTKPTGDTTIYDHWGFDDNSDVANTIIAQNKFMKPPTIDPALTKVGRLPVFTSPAGGLPGISASGESIIATNEELGKNYNKMLTYTQQLVRDTANPRWLELSNSENGILRQEDLFKRGAIFRGAPGETVQPIPTPPIPVELRQAVMDYQNQMQRGLFPWSVFGNIQQQTSYLAMASIASSSLSVLTPYIEAIKGVLSDIDNFWFSLIKNGMKPYKFKMPKSMPEEFTIEAQLDVEIPGYLVQRATVARMLNPEFQLPVAMVMNRLFPEVVNPMKAMAETRKDKAMNNPIAITADTILAYRAQARAMREVGDVEGADLYEKVAKTMEAQVVAIGQPPPTQQQAQPAREVAPTRELAPPEETGQEGM